MIPFIITLSCVFATILVALLIGARYAYNSAFSSKGSAAPVSGYFKKSGSLVPLKEKIDSLSTKLTEDEFEEIYITAYDSISLYARYYHVKDEAPVQIFMHGYKGNPDRSMCGSYVIARSLGHNVLVVDQRGCRKSGGKAVTFGVKERLDAASWVNYICNRFGNVPIFLVGISLGGASVLMASDLSLPKNVVGIIADCPFSSPKKILKKVCCEHGVPKPLYPIVTLGAILFAHFNPNKYSATESVKNTNIPILLLHGKKDGFVPFSMAEEIYHACGGEKYLYEFDEADHAVCYMVDSKKYTTAVTDFTEKCLKS